MAKNKICLIQDIVMPEDKVKLFDFIEKEYDAELVKYYYKKDCSLEDSVADFQQMEREGPDSFDEDPELTEVIKDCDFVIDYMSPINSKSYANAKNLKAICVMRSGVENINIKKASAQGIKVMNCPSRLAVPVSEYTIGMIIAEVRSLARGHENLMKGNWQMYYSNQNDTFVLQGRTVGIVGFGGIGRRVAKVLAAMEANIVVYDPYCKKEEVENLGYKHVTLNELCEVSDVVSMHYRLTPETKGMFSKEQFEKMSKHAYLINTARADLIDQEALLDALQNKKIAGAALDVHYEEPLGTDNPFLKLDNVTLTPHLAGTSSDEFDVTFRVAEKAIRQYLEKGELINTVN